MRSCVAGVVEWDGGRVNPFTNHLPNVPRIHQTGLLSLFTTSPNKKNRANTKIHTQVVAIRTKLFLIGIKAFAVYSLLLL